MAVQPVALDPDPARLAIHVGHVDGRVSRWAEDEDDPAGIFGDLSFTTALPGGFKTFDCPLTRAQKDVTPIGRFDDIRVYGPGNVTAWAGFQSDLPKTSGEGWQMNAGGLGWSASLLFDPSFRAIYVDRDLGGWTGFAANRRASLLNAGTYTLFDPTTDADEAGLPAVSLTVEDDWTGSDRPLIEAWYDGLPGQPLTQLYYSQTSYAAHGGAWVFTLFFADDRDGTGTTSAAVLSASSSSAGYVTLGKRVAFWQLHYTIAGGAPGDRYARMLRSLTVYGTNLQTYAVNGTDPKGVKVSDVIGHIISTAAPLLRPTDIADGEVVVPHLVFREATTPEDAILVANGFELYDWGCYGEDGRDFFWRHPTDYRRRWRLRLDEGATIDLEGEQTETAYNGVIVRYTDVTGVPRSIGPPEASFVDAVDGRLADARPENPVNAAGIPRKWGILDVSFTTVTEAAILLGAKWMERTQIPSNRGSVSAPGMIRDDKGNWCPSWEMRAGDSVVVEDYDATERRIVETGYTHNPERSISATLDSLPNRLDAIMERMSVSLVGEVS